MPEIREYAPTAEVAGPMTGVRANASDFDIGPGLERMGQAVEHGGYLLQRYGQMKDTSKVHASLSAIEAQAHNEWNEQLRTYNPNQDPTQDEQQRKQTTDTFLQNLDDRIDQAGEGITSSYGQKYFQQAAAELRGRFSKHVSDTMSVLAGENAKASVTNSLNGDSTIVAGAPSLFGEKLKSNEDFAQKMVDTGAWSQLHADQFKTLAGKQLAISAVNGWITQLGSPEQAKDSLDRGTYDSYFDNKTKEQLYQKVDQAFKLRDAAAEKLRRDQDRAQKEQDSQTATGFINRINADKPDPNIHQDILASNLPGLGNNSKETLFKLLDTKNKLGTSWKSDPHALEEVYRRIDLPDGDPDKIHSQAEVSAFMGNGPGKINPTDMTKAQKYLATGTTQRADDRKAMSDIAHQKFVEISKAGPDGIPATPELGDQGQRAAQNIRQAYQDGLNKGIPSRDLLTPGNSHYIGKVSVPTMPSRLNSLINYFSSGSGAQPTNRFNGGPAVTGGLPQTRTTADGKTWYLQGDGKTYLPTKKGGK